MRLFFDTEFTGLTSDPRLLSIGLVADNGNELYLELTDGWTDANCSAWVREHVMPMLGKGERLTRRETANRILSWLSSFETPSTLLGETDWDMPGSIGTGITFFVVRLPTNAKASSCWPDSRKSRALAIRGAMISM